MTRGKFIAMIFGGAWLIGIIGFLIMSPHFRAGRKLLKAAETGDISTVNALLSTGASLFNRDREGHSALWLAAYNGHCDVVKSLLEHKADANTRGHDGWTPLMWAVYTNKIDVAQLLISHGGNVNAQGLNGETAIKLAKDSPPMMALLKKSGAR